MRVLGWPGAGGGCTNEGVGALAEGLDLVEEERERAREHVGVGRAVAGAEGQRRQHDARGVALVARRARRARDGRRVGVGTHPQRQPVWREHLGWWWCGVGKWNGKGEGVCGVCGQEDAVAGEVGWEGRWGREVPAVGLSPKVLQMQRKGCREKMHWASLQ